MNFLITFIFSIVIPVLLGILSVLMFDTLWVFLFTVPLTLISSFFGQHLAKY